MFAAIANRFAVIDPGMLQLRLAARVTVSTGIAVAIIIAVGYIPGFQGSGMSVGAIIAMFGASIVNEPTFFRRTTATLVLAAPALVAVAAAAALSAWPLAADAGFVAAVFLAVTARRFGPRWTPIGMMLFMPYFAAMLLKVPLRGLPLEVVGVAIGLVGAIAAQWLAPDRPVRALRHIRKAIPVQIAKVLRDVREATAAQFWTRRRRRWLLRHMAELDDMVVKASGQIDAVFGPPTPDICAAMRLKLLRLQLAVERIAMIALTDPPQAARLIGDVGAFGMPDDRPARSEDVADPPGHGASRQRNALTMLRDALAAIENSQIEQAILDCQAERGRGKSSKETDGADRLSGAAPVRSPADRLWPDRQTRIAIQATMASVAALYLGQLISPRGWYWAVLTSFIVFMRADSNGSTLLRSVQRSAGTLVGVFVGIGAAELLAGQKQLDLFLMFPCIFIGFFFLRTSYGVMVMWFMVMVALFYDVVGRFSTGIFMARLAETALGAALGVAAGAMLLPVRTSDEVFGKLARLLERIGEAVETTRPKPRDGAPLLLAAGIQHAFEDLRAAAQPLTLGWEFRTPTITAEILATAMGASYWARELCLLALENGAGGRGDSAADEALGRVQSRLRALRAKLKDGAIAFKRPGEPARGAPEFGSEAAADGALRSAEAAHGSRRPGPYLAQLDGSMTRLAHQLGVP